MSIRHPRIATIGDVMLDVIVRLEQPLASTDAVQIALARAGVTISGIHHAHVKDITATVENNQVSQWRVAIQVSFIVKDQLHE